jgi:hypothetical protein
VLRKIVSFAKLCKCQRISEFSEFSDVSTEISKYQPIKRYQTSSLSAKYHVNVSRGTEAAPQERSGRVNAKASPTSQAADGH